MKSDLQEFETVQPKRPTFLTVLCILTFVGSSYALISGIISYFNADSVSKIVESAQSKMHDENKNSDGNGLASKMMKNVAVMSNPDNIRNTSLGNIVTSVFCLLGAFLMWKLNRTGFYIYVLGTLIGIIIPFYLYGSNFLTNIAAGTAGFIGLLFVIFYAMNLKSMNRQVAVS